MGYLILIIGVALWWAAHLFKRVAPARREAFGRGPVALAILASVVLMVVGYRMAPFTPVWEPPGFMVHLNNLLVLTGIWMMSPAGTKGKLLSGVRHPMLMGFRMWAFAHLLVNGDLASLILFGGLLAWAVAEVPVINAAEPQWEKRKDGSFAKDGMFFVASIVLVGVIGFIHGLIGPSAFPV